MEENRYRIFVFFKWDIPNSFIHFINRYRKKYKKIQLFDQTKL